MKFYDMDGQVITRNEWIKLWETRQKIAIDKIGEFQISTVWLGLDHSFGSTGAPFIFETMIFCNNESHSLHETRWLYSTREEAEHGHTVAVALCREEVS